MVSIRQQYIYRECRCSDGVFIPEEKDLRGLVLKVRLLIIFGAYNHGCEDREARGLTAVHHLRG